MGVRNLRLESNRPANCRGLSKGDEIIAKIAKIVRVAMQHKSPFAVLDLRHDWHRERVHRSIDPVLTNDCIHRKLNNTVPRYEENSAAVW